MQVPAAEIHQALRTGMLYQHAGRFPQAEAIYRQLLRTVPNHPEAWHLLGTIALHEGRLDEAVRLIRQAIRLNSSNPEYYSNLGFSFHEQGMLDVAEENYRKALVLKPDYVNANYNLHALLLDTKGSGDSIQCLNRVLEVTPADSEARFMLGVSLDYSGENAAAAQQFGQLENGSALDLARLDAWRYLKSASGKLPRIAGSMMQTFRLALEAAPSEGLMLEFGVRFGNTIRQIAGLVKQPVHGFDSFEGLPEVWHHEPKGSYTTKGEIPEVPGNVALHVGWFEDTLPVFLENNSGPVRFMNIDCDIYSSTKTVLDLLAPRIVPGTVIVFDEYIGNEHWREDEFKAFQEAVARYGWSYEYLCFSVFTKQAAVRIKSL